MRLIVNTLLALLLTSGGLIAQKGTESVNSPAPREKNIYEKPGVTLPAGSGSEEIMALLYQRIPLLANTGSALTTSSYKESPGGYHYLFQQEYGGLPIYHAAIKVNLNKDYKVMNWLNGLVDFDPIAPPAFDRSLADAETYIQQTFEAGQWRFSFKVTPHYMIEQNQLTPVYVAETDGSDMNWEVILDGRDLSELVRRDRAVRHHHKPVQVTLHPNGGDTTGTGLVFNPDPLTTAGVSYGGAYVDNGDNDSQALNDERVTVTLRDICYQNGVFKLEGPHVVLRDVESPTIPIATSTNGTFNYTRSQDGFEDVMCYYHIDFYQRYIQSQGFNNLYNDTLIVDPHGLNGWDNSHFVPNGSSSRVAFGEGGVDDAEDADVIIHEYGHALSYSGSPNTNFGFERQGLDEGIGDYLAASYSRTLSIFSWEDIFTWDGHNIYWAGRSAAFGSSYPPGGGADIYTYGQIWATVLMEIYGDVKKNVSDKNFFQSLYGHAGQMTLTDAGHVIIDADSMLYGGFHTATYQTHFCNKGIFSGQDCIIGIEDGQWSDLRWNVFPNPSAGELYLNLRGMDQIRGLHWRVINAIGQEVKQGTVEMPVEVLGTEGLEKGMYLVLLETSSGERIGTKKVMLR